MSQALTSPIICSLHLRVGIVFICFAKRITRQSGTCVCMCSACPDARQYCIERRFSFFGNDFRYKTHVIPAVVVCVSLRIIIILIPVPGIEYSFECGVDRCFLFHSALFCRFIHSPFGAGGNKQVTKAHENKYTR